MCLGGNLSQPIKVLRVFTKIGVSSGRCTHVCGEGGGIVLERNLSTERSVRKLLMISLDVRG